MSEYVIKGAEPNETVLHTRTPNGYEEWRWLPVREEIVRCRDCKFCMSYWGADYCDYFSHVTNDPDGFCAWAVKRED